MRLPLSSLAETYLSRTLANPCSWCPPTKAHGVSNLRFSRLRGMKASGDDPPKLQIFPTPPIKIQARLCLSPGAPAQLTSSPLGSTTSSTGWNASLTAHDQQENCIRSLPTFDDHPHHYSRLLLTQSRVVWEELIGRVTRQCYPGFSLASWRGHPHGRASTPSELLLSS